MAFGPGQVHKLAEFLTSDSLTAQGFFEFEGFTGHLPGKRARDVHAWVQISRRLQHEVLVLHRARRTRGREVSRPFDELVDEVRALAAEGVREVTLLGQNVNSYGTRLRPQPRKFSELLPAVDAIDGIDRIRYTSPHPAHMPEDVIRAHAELESVCQHIHLPLQSGSSRVLKAMRRTYDRGRYLDRVALIREHVPDCALTTDIIVGFPGETEADFVGDARGRRGGRLRRRVHVHLLAAPRHRGRRVRRRLHRRTRSQVERMERLVEVVQRRARERAQRFVGRTLDVLVEGTSRHDPSRLRGRTTHNKVVNFDGLAVAGRDRRGRDRRGDEPDAHRQRIAALARRVKRRLT